MMRCGVLLLVLLPKNLYSTSQSPISSNQVGPKQETQHSSGVPRFPGFNVEVTLSGKAKERLTKSKEVIVVFSMFSGSPSKEARKLHSYEMGEVGLGELEIEVPVGVPAKFREITLKPDALEQTDKQAPQLLVNVYSGRKSSKNNLLNCDIYEGSLIAVQAKNIAIHCALIAEKYSMTNVAPIK